MDRIIIRSMLLKRDLFYDNCYLEAYCNLMEDNEFRDKEIYKTNSHHIIPKHVFKKAGLSYDDTDKNKINLLFKDHILAHYYLYMCSKDEDCKADNDKAIRCLVKKDWKNTNLFEELDKFQKEYEDYSPIIMSNLKCRKKLNKLKKDLDCLEV